MCQFSPYTAGQWEGFKSQSRFSQSLSVIPGISQKKVWADEIS
jgi:hypothetical protein